MNADKSNIVDELQKPARTNFQRRRVVIRGLDELWQDDIVEMGAYSSDNDAYSYLLTVTNTFSKFAYALPLKTKTGVEVTKAMRTVLMKGIPQKIYKQMMDVNFSTITFEN